MSVEASAEAREASILSELAAAPGTLTHRNEPRLVLRFLQQLQARQQGEGEGERDTDTRGPVIGWYRGAPTEAGADDGGPPGANACFHFHGFSYPADQLQACGFDCGASGAVINSARHRPIV